MLFPELPSNSSISVLYLQVFLHKIILANLQFNNIRCINVPLELLLLLFVCLLDPEHQETTPEPPPEISSTRPLQEPTSELPPDVSHPHLHQEPTPQLPSDFYASHSLQELSQETSLDLSCESEPLDMLSSECKHFDWKGVGSVPPNIPPKPPDQFQDIISTQINVRQELG